MEILKKLIEHLRSKREYIVEDFELQHQTIDPTYGPRVYTKHVPVIDFDKLCAEIDAFANSFHTIDQEAIEQRAAEVVTELTPVEKRAAGWAYCPKCYTFGSYHRRGCIYAPFGTEHHVRTAHGT